MPALTGPPQVTGYHGLMKAARGATMVTFQFVAKIKMPVTKTISLVRVHQGVNFTAKVVSVRMHPMLSSAK